MFALLFARSDRLDRQGVDGPRQLVSERCVDPPLSLNPAKPGESVAGYDDVEVGFAAPF